MDNKNIQEKIDNIEDAIAEGALEVEFQGKRIKYRSLDEMRRISNTLKQSLQRHSGLKVSVAVFEKN